MLMFLDPFKYIHLLSLEYFKANWVAIEQRQSLRSPLIWAEFLYEYKVYPKKRKKNIK